MSEFSCCERRPGKCPYTVCPVEDGGGLGHVVEYATLLPVELECAQPEPVQEFLHISNVYALSVQARMVVT